IDAVGLHVGLGGTCIALLAHAEVLAAARRTGTTEPSADKVVGDAGPAGVEVEAGVHQRAARARDEVAVDHGSGVIEPDAARGAERAECLDTKRLTPVGGQAEVAADVATAAR